MKADTDTSLYEILYDTKYFMYMKFLSVECKTKTESDHDKKYGVPSLEDLGKSEKECGPLLFPGGETEALRRLESMMGKKVINALNIAYNTVKSWFLRINTIHWQIGNLVFDEGISSSAWRAMII